MPKIQISKPKPSVAQALAQANRPIVAARPVAAARPVIAAKPVSPVAPIAVAPVEKRGPGRPPKAETEARRAAEAAAAPVSALRPGTYTGDGKGNLVPVVRQAPANTSSEAAFIKAIDELKATVQMQNEALAKYKAKATNVRPMSDIVDGADNGLESDDWRLGYNGASATLHQYTRDKALEIVVDPRLPTVNVILAIPRMTDAPLEGDRHSSGSKARSFGQLAAYIVREDGELEGPTDYLYQHDLANAWAD